MELQVIKEGKNAKGDELQVVTAGGSYGVRVKYNGKWMIIEHYETKAEALNGYRSFGGK